MNEAECLRRQHDCRTDLYSRLGRKLGLWTAIVLIGVVSAIVGVCFAFSVSAQAKAADVGQAAAVQAAAQAKENEFFRRDLEELKIQNREILAIVRTLEREKK